MGTFLLLMAEASAVNAELAAGEGHDFGLNFDILETNLINLVIIISVLFFFGRKVVGKTLSDRRERIETAIIGAEKRAAQAKAALESQQQKLAQAQAEAEKIRNNAAENATAAREKILARATADIERLKETASQDLNAERDRAITQLRQRVVAMALAKVESQLQSGVDQETQQKLIDRSITLLGGRS